MTAAAAAVPTFSRALQTTLWLGLLAALSPVLLDWARHLAAEPEVRYAAVFIPLGLHLARIQPVPTARRSWGLWLLVAALCFCVLAVGGGVSRFARLGMPFAVLGMAVWLGRPSPAIAALALWTIPVPSFLMQMGGRLLEALPALPIALEPFDLGLPLAALLSGLAYHAALARDEDMRTAVRAAILAALLALPLQAAAVGLALGVAALGAPELARASLSHGLTLVAAGLVAQRLMATRLAELAARMQRADRGRVIVGRRPPRRPARTAALPPVVEAPPRRRPAAAATRRPRPARGGESS